MTQGRFIGVVGPSGVGKDSVMAGLAAALPGLLVVRRAITRPPGPGEDHLPLTGPEFAARAEAGGFCLWWDAHGLSYGIPSEVRDAVAAGRDAMANLSRGALVQAASVFPRLTVLNITATPETLARRLAARGRESGTDIRDRLARAAFALPDGIPALTIANDGALEDAVAQALRLLQAERA